MPSDRLRLLPAACLLGLVVVTGSPAAAWAQTAEPGATEEPAPSPSTASTPLVPLPAPDPTEEPEPEPAPEPEQTATAAPTRTSSATRRPRRTPSPTPVPVRTVEPAAATEAALPTPTALPTLPPPLDPLDVGLTTPEPLLTSAAPAAAPGRPVDPVTRSLRLALGAAALLGLGGLAGLYLTREPR